MLWAWPLLCLPWQAFGAAMPVFGGSMGVPECPCLRQDSPTAQKAAPQLVARGIRKDYGLRGCAPYDLEHNDVMDCIGASEDDPDKIHCFFSWCWVDPEACSVNHSSCERVGSTASPACRDRPKVKSGMITDPQLWYSFEACGMMDVYNFNPQNMFPEMTNRTLLITPLEIKSVVYKDREGRWTGSQYQLVKASLRSFAGTSLLVARPDISEESRLHVNGSKYTACVHDVAIRRLDLCICPLWLTEERLQMASFLPSLEDDPMNFLVPAAEERPSFVGYLGKPFRPFSPYLWIFTFGFFLFSVGALLCSECNANFEHFPEEEDRLQHTARTCYYVFMALFSGGPMHTPVTWPGRLVTMGLSFFVMIAVSTYTANLASFLVSSTLATEVTSFTEAVRSGYRICVNSVIEPQLKSTYPEIGKDQLSVPLYESECPQQLARGLVQGIILGGEATDKLHAGQFVVDDCMEGKPYSKDLRVCPRDAKGGLDLKRDCSLVTVGTPPLRISMSYPVAEELQRPLSWAILRQVGLGRYKAFEEQFFHKSWQASNICPKFSAVDTSEALPIQAISGTATISVILVTTGVIWALLRMAGYCPEPRDWMPDTMTAWGSDIANMGSEAISTAQRASRAVTTTFPSVRTDSDEPTPPTPPTPPDDHHA